MQDLKIARIEPSPRQAAEGYRNEFPAWMDADGKMVVR